MKITKLELFRISVPLIQPYALSKTYGVKVNADAIIFKIYTDKGIVGLGEADPWHPFTPETPSSVMAVTRDIIGPQLIDRDPRQKGILESLLDGTVNGNLAARGAVNMALYDIIGKVNCVPVYVLLGGIIHRELPLLGAIGSGTVEEDMIAIEQHIEKRCKCIMLKMGVLPIVDEIKRMMSARKHFTGQIKFIVDPNQGWDVADTIEFLNGLEGYNPNLLEQPICAKHIRELSRIRDRAPCPVSADESLANINDARELILNESVDVFSIKVSKNGGLDKSFRIATIAEAFGIKCLMNSMLEFGITQAASLQLGCTLTNLIDMGHAYGSVLRMADDITDFSTNIMDGKVRVPEENGLGVKLNEDNLQKYTKEILVIK